MLSSTSFFHPFSDYAVQKEAELKMLTERVKTGGKGVTHDEKKNKIKQSSEDIGTQGKIYMI